MFNVCKSLSLPKMIFSTQNIYALGISLILNKKKNDHVTIAYEKSCSNPWLRNFDEILSQYSQRMKTRSHKVLEGALGKEGLE